MKYGKMIKNCLICKKELYRSANKYSIKKRIGKKHVTCGGECSKTYRKIHNYIRNKKCKSN